jgi:hypothetical protein
VLPSVRARSLAAAIGAAVAFAAAPGMAGASVLHVDACAAAGGDGGSWDGALRFLQDALAAARAPGSGVTEIRLAGGVYRANTSDAVPGGVYDPAMTFRLASGLAVRGGFAGIASADPDARDPALHETVLDGRYFGPAPTDCCGVHDTPACDCPGCAGAVCAIVPACCERAWDAVCSALAALVCPHLCQGPAPGMIARLVTTGDADRTAVLDGLTLVGGHETIYHGGGGLAVVDCSITGASVRAVRNLGGGHAAFTRCTFRGEAVAAGVKSEGSAATFVECTFITCRGALDSTGSSLAVLDCLFLENTGAEGGMIVNRDSVVEINRTTFANNGGSAVFSAGGSVTVTECTFSGGISNHGGAIRNEANTAFISNCVFQANVASLGGAIMNEWARSVTVTECLFADNLVPGSQPAAGGAVYDVTSHSVYERCTFERNRAGPEEPHGGHYGGGSGGAIFCAGSELTVSDCVFTDNVAVARGGAVTATAATVRIAGSRFTGNRATLAYGGAISSEAPGTCVLRDCLFEGNAARWGGAVAGLYGGAPLISHCRFLGNGTSDYAGGALFLGWLDGTALVFNCEFAGNVAWQQGGAVAAFPESDVSLVNCTLVANTALSAGGGVFVGAPPGGPQPGSSARVVNCILWGNADAGGSDESAQTHVEAATSSLVVEYSCIQNAFTLLGSTGNIGDDPLLIDPDGPDGVAGTQDDDLRLSAGSHSAEAGFNNAVPADLLDLDGDGDRAEFVPVDLGGLPRFVDDAAPDGGCGAPALVDMGAHELQGGSPDQPRRGDMTGDGRVGTADLELLLDAWGPCDGCCPADLDADGDVGVVDFLALLQGWT